MNEETVVLDFSDFAETEKPALHHIVTTIVREYDTDGNLIRVWNNIAMVAKAFGVPYHQIRKCAISEILQVKNRIFIMGNADVADRIALIKQEEEKKALKKAAEEAYNKSMEIRVYTSSGEYLRTCRSIKEASDIYELQKSVIFNQSSGRACVTNGLIFLREDETIEDRLKRIKNRKTHKKNL